MLPRVLATVLLTRAYLRLRTVQRGRLASTSRSFLSVWLAVSMLATPGMGALSMARDLASTPVARSVVGGAGTALQATASQLPRIGVVATVVGLIAGLFGAPDSSPIPAEAQSANDVSYIYDALGRLRAVVDPAGDTATYNYDTVGNLLSIGRQSSALTSVIELSPISGSTGSSVAIEGTGFSATPGREQRHRQRRLCLEERHSPVQWSLWPEGQPDLEQHLHRSG